MDHMTPSLSLRADNLVKTRSVVLDWQDFLIYAADLRTTTDAVAMLLTESSDLSAPLIYHYRGLLNKLLRRLAEVADEREARQVEQENARKSVDQDEERPPLNRFTRAAWSSTSKR